MIQQDVIWQIHYDYKMQLPHLCSLSQVGIRIWLLSTLGGFILTLALTGRQTGHETNKTKVWGDKHTGLCRPNCDCWLKWSSL